jgi:hypothetical protein
MDLAKSGEINGDLRPRESRWPVVFTEDAGSWRRDYAGGRPDGRRVGTMKKKNRGQSRRLRPLLFLIFLLSEVHIQAFEIGPRPG